MDDYQHPDARRLGDEYNAVIWGQERFHLICYVHGDDIKHNVDEAARVDQELYVEEGQEEAVLRIFTSSEAAREFLAKINLKKEYISYLKIVGMGLENALGVCRQVDKRHQDRNSFIRCDVIGVDGRREILYSRLITKH